LHGTFAAASATRFDSDWWIEALLHFIFEGTGLIKDIDLQITHLPWSLSELGAGRT
jgi:hypothetical protein